MTAEARRWVAPLLSATIALVMITGGLAHLVEPAGFARLVPAPLPATPIILGTGLIQLAIGLLALWPRTRARAGLAFAVLCLGYLPLHLWDFARPDPVFAPPVAATAQVLIQLVFIAAGWRLSRTAGSAST